MIDGKTLDLTLVLSGAERLVTRAVLHDEFVQMFSSTRLLPEYRIMRKAVDAMHVANRALDDLMDSYYIFNKEQRSTFSEDIIRYKQKEVSTDPKIFFTDIIGLLRNVVSGLYSSSPDLQQRIEFGWELEEIASTCEESIRSLVDQLYFPELRVTYNYLIFVGGMSHITRMCSMAMEERRMGFSIYEGLHYNMNYRQDLLLCGDLPEDELPTKIINNAVDWIHQVASAAC